MSNRVRLVRYASCTITAAAALLGAQQASAAKCLTAEQSMAEIMKPVRPATPCCSPHRGSWGKYNPDDQTIPENSIAAAETAKANCMDGIELDVKESKDGVLY